MQPADVVVQKWYERPTPEELTIQPARLPLRNPATELLKLASPGRRPQLAEPAVANPDQEPVAEEGGWKPAPDCPRDIPQGRLPQVLQLERL